MSKENEESKDDGKETFDKFMSMELPRRVVLGKDALEKIGKTCNELKLRKSGLIVCDSTTRKIAGERAFDLLEEEGYDLDIIEIDGADQEAVKEVQDALNDRDGFTVGVGGGKPIDVAKYTAHLSDIPFISVPTASSHDGIASGRASIERNGNKTSVKAHTPLTVVADTGIIADSPHRLMAAGCGDIVANATAVKDWRLAKRLRHESFSHYAAQLSEMTANILIENAENIKPGSQDSAWLVVKALVSSSVAMSIAGTSRPASGSEHKFSHTLDSQVDEPALHGEQCGVGTIIMMYLHGGDWKKIKKTLQAVGAPTTARGLELTEEEIVDALVEAPKIRPERYTILGNRRMNRKAAEEAARETGVI